MYPPHDLGGGYELTWRSSVQHLRALGHDMHVLTSDHRVATVAAADEPGVTRELRSYWRDHEFPRMSVRRRIAHERHNAAVLERTLGATRPDAVAWWGMGGLSLGLIERVRRAGIPAVGVVGDEWMVWGPRADGWLKPLRMRPRLARAAERVTGLPAAVDLGGAATWLFNSERTRSASLAAGWQLPRTRVAHPGIDEHLFRPAPPPASWGWRLLYVGRMDDRKGVHLAVDALSRLPEEATLVLQGSGDDDYVERLHARVRERELDGRVRFQQLSRPELPEVYAAADAILFPTQWEEPWGLVPLEAMAVGRPVVASGTGGSAEYLRHGENCLLYQPRDSARGLAETVERLAGDAELRDRLRAGGASTAARFTARAYDDAIAEALEEAVARGDSGSIPARAR
jgi:glycosyltransferase involved in cell wall biosynthesis